MVSPQNEPNWQNHYTPPKAEIGPRRSNNDRTVGRWAVVTRGVLGILGILGSWSLLGIFTGEVIQEIYVWWRYQGGTREPRANRLFATMMRIWPFFWAGLWVA
jgi:hypothetical protein